MGLTQRQWLDEVHAQLDGTDNGFVLVLHDDDHNEVELWITDVRTGENDVIEVWVTTA